MPPDLHSKLPDAGISIFAHMTALANRHGAINLAQGFPDFAPPEQLFAYLDEGVRSGYNQYAAMPGLPQLRTALARRLRDRYDCEADPDSTITVTAGATQSIYTAISAFVRPGDKVLIFEPAYDSYGPAVRINGGQALYLRLELPDFSIPWDALEQLLSKETVRMVLVNNPHNPAGSILCADDLLRIGELTRRHNSLLLWDEVYDLLVFDGKRHRSALEFPILRDRSIVVFSIGKTLHNTGWKIGYAVAPEALTNELRKVHQFLVFSVNTPAQYAVARFLDSHPGFTDELHQFYQTRRDLFWDLLRGHPDFEFLPCRGSYFALARFRASATTGDLAYAEHLVATLGVAAIPISAFYHDAHDPGLLRFCFAKKEETLREAARLLWLGKA